MPNGNKLLILLNYDNTVSVDLKIEFADALNFFGIYSPSEFGAVNVLCENGIIRIEKLSTFIVLEMTI
jgi:hypothetical protein